MPYWIARPIPNGTGYYIGSVEEFLVRSNAEAYIRRRNWQGCLVVTDDQRIMIESTGQIESETAEEEAEPEKKDRRGKRGGRVVSD